MFESNAIFNYFSQLERNQVWHVKFDIWTGLDWITARVDNEFCTKQSVEFDKC